MNAYLPLGYEFGPWYCDDERPHRSHLVLLAGYYERCSGPSAQQVAADSNIRTLEIVEVGSAPVYLHESRNLPR